MKHDLNSLPTIITNLGKYKTRSNKIVDINCIIPSSNTTKLEFNCCHRLYDNHGKIFGTKSWHKSGRFSQYSVSPSDIIERID
jgi:hypothetical protein